MLRSGIDQWRREVIARRCAKGNDPACSDIEFYVVEVNLAAVSDPVERARLQGLPTSLRIESGDVNALRDAARDALSHSPEFQRLLTELMP